MPIGCRFPVPDAWRLEYPHYIANRTSLRWMYFFVLLVCGSTFFGYGYFKYEIDLDTTTRLSTEALDGWTCESLNEYTGGFDFFRQLSLNISTNLNAQVWGSGIFQSTGLNYDAENGTFYQSDEIFNSDQMDSNTGWDLIGVSSTGTVSDCRKNWGDTLCEIEDNQVTDGENFLMLSDDFSFYYVSIHIDAVAFRHIVTTGNLTIGNGNIDNNVGQYFEDDRNLLIYDGRLSTSTPQQWQIPQYNSSYDNTSIDIGFTLFATLDQVCDIIELGNDGEDGDGEVQVCFLLNDDVDYFDYEWCLSDGTDIITLSTCQEIETDVCMVNLATAFNTSYDNNGKILFERDNWEEIGIFFSTGVYSQAYDSSDTDANLCSAYWEDECTTVIDSFCDTVYVPPFQCEKDVQRSIIDVVAISFAQTEFVLTVLLIVVGFSITRVCCCCIKKDHRKPDYDELEAGGARKGSILVSGGQSSVGNEDDAKCTQLEHKIQQMEQQFQTRIQQLENRIAQLQMNQNTAEFVAQRTNSAHSSPRAAGEYQMQMQMQPQMAYGQMQQQVQMQPQPQFFNTVQMAQMNQMQ